MSDDLKVDWGKPIEAYHEDGRVAAATIKGREILWGQRPGVYSSIVVDGRTAYPGWRIRNVADVPCISKAPSDVITLPADQAAMLRKVLAAISGCVGTTIGHQTFFVPAQVVQDARDALALLPEPVDADEQWAIEQVAAHGYSDRRRPDQRTLVEIMTACVQHGRTRALERDSREG